MRSIIYEQLTREGRQCKRKETNTCKAHHAFRLLDISPLNRWLPTTGKRFSGNMDHLGPLTEMLKVEDKKFAFSKHAPLIIRQIRGLGGRVEVHRSSLSCSKNAQITHKFHAVTTKPIHPFTLSKDLGLERMATILFVWLPRIPLNSSLCSNTVWYKSVCRWLFTQPVYYEHPDLFN